MFKSIITAAVLAMSAMAASASCPVKDARVCEVYTKAQAVAEVRPVAWSPNTTSLAAEYEWGFNADVIHLGDTQFLDDDVVFFLIAHELGHSIKKHGRQFIEAFASEAERSMSDAELVKRYANEARDFGFKQAALNRQQEFEADEFAVNLMLAHGKDPVAAMKKLLKNRVSSSMYPTRKQRIDRAEQISQAFRPQQVAKL